MDMFLFVLLFLSGSKVFCSEYNRSLATPNFLPSVSIPFHYNIKINVHLGPEYDGADGMANITINVIEKTKILIVHANKDVQMETKTIRLIDIKTGNEFRPIATSHNEDNDFFQMKFVRELMPAKYVLSLPFQSKYSPTIGGMLLRDYIDPHGVKRYVVATNLQPIQARKIFPCYDEPKLKASFKMIIEHPKQYRAVSNMPVLTMRYSGNETITTFETSPPMSTYLVAFAVIEFDLLRKTQGGKPYHGHVIPGKLENATFALNLIVGGVNYLEELTEVKYSLPKLDYVTIPKFSGGMENWGLITLDPSVLISEDSTRQGEFMVTFLVFHETVHQWFGNLVTNEWWDYVWLHEGFAMFYANILGDRIFPQIRFVYNNVLEYQHVLDSDVDQRAEALNRHVEDKYYIANKLNQIAYYKGSAIVRFMYYLFPKFNEAVTSYLKRHLYRTVTPNDLYYAINQYPENRKVLPPGIEVEKIMNNWADNPGFPLITVNVSFSYVTVIDVHQKQFSSQRNITTTNKWWIPITLSVEENPQFDNLNPFVWLPNDTNSISFTTVRTDGWVILNHQNLLYCRINYNIENWQRIIRYLQGPNYARIHVLNRQQLVSDVTALAKESLVRNEIAMDLLRYLEHEHDDIPKKAGGKALLWYAFVMRDTDAYPLFLRYLSAVCGQDCMDVLADQQRGFSYLINDAVTTSVIRPHALYFKLQEIAEAIWSMEKPKLIDEVASRFLNAGNERSKEVQEFLKFKIDQYNDAKQRFLERDYADVKKWLEAHY